MQLSTGANADIVMSFSLTSRHQRFQGHLAFLIFKQSIYMFQKGCDFFFLYVNWRTSREKVRSSVETHLLLTH